MAYGMSGQVRFIVGCDETGTAVTMPPFFTEWWRDPCHKGEVTIVHYDGNEQTYPWYAVATTLDTDEQVLYACQHMDRVHEAARAAQAAQKAYEAIA